MNKLKLNIKNIVFSSILLIIFVGVLSCRNKDIVEPSVVSNTDWRAKIEALNSKYAQKAGMDISRKKSINRIKSETVTPNGGENMPNGGITDGEEIEGEENGDNGNNQANDQKAKQDRKDKASKAIIKLFEGSALCAIGVYALQFGPIGVAVAVAAGAVGAHEAAEATIECVEMVTEEFDVYEAYKEEQQKKIDEGVQKNELFIYKDFDRTVFVDDEIFSPRTTPDYIEKIFQNTSENRLEWAYPINKLYEFPQPFNNAIGVEVGPMISFTISQMMTNPYYAQMEERDAIYSIISDYHMGNSYERDQAYCLLSDEGLMEEIKNSVNEAYNNISYLEGRLEEISSEVGIDEYFAISSNLDKHTQREYADAYTRIVQNAYVSGFIGEEEAFIINASISSGYYGNLLWRPVVETPYTTNVRMAFDVEHNRIIYCDDNMLNSLLVLGEVSFWGIPHFVNDCLTEVYFYGGANDFGSLPDMESITIDNKTDYNFYNAPSSDGRIINYHRLQPGQYPISHLDQLGVRYIQTYNVIY